MREPTPGPTPAPGWTRARRRRPSTVPGRGESSGGRRWPPWSRARTATPCPHRPPGFAEAPRLGSPSRPRREIAPPAWWAPRRRAPSPRPRPERCRATTGRRPHPRLEARPGCPRSRSRHRALAKPRAVDPGSRSTPATPAAPPAARASKSRGRARAGRQARSPRRRRTPIAAGRDRSPARSAPRRADDQRDRAGSTTPGGWWSVHWPKSRRGARRRRWRPSAPARRWPATRPGRRLSAPAPRRWSRSPDPAPIRGPDRRRRCRQGRVSRSRGAQEPRWRRPRRPRAPQGSRPRAPMGVSGRARQAP